MDKDVFVVVEDCSLCACEASDDNPYKVKPPVDPPPDR